MASKHDPKRPQVESMLEAGKTVTEIAQALNIPEGSMGYLIRRWSLTDKQVRHTGKYSARARRSWGRAYKRIHASGASSGENHWSHGLLKLHGEFVPEAEIKEILSELVEQDLTLAAMAHECGVDPKTITNWLKRFDMQQGIRSGDRCSWYKGGWIKDRGPDWLKVRKQILERDGYKCTRCGSTQDECRQRGHALNIHHIVPWRESHDNSPTNLQSLCQPCHMVVEWQSGVWSESNGEG